MVRSLARKVLGAEIAVVRAPIALLDSTVVGRLPERSAVRRSVEGAIGVLDAVSARVRGTGSASRPDLLPVPVSEAPSAEIVPMGVDRTAAGTDSAAGTDTDTEAAVEIVEVIEADQEAIAQALLDEEEQRRHVGELAELDDDEQRRQAELMAKHRAQELQEERELKEAEPERVGPAPVVKKAAAAKKAPAKAAAKAAPGKAAPAKAAATKSPAKKAPGGSAG